MTTTRTEVVIRKSTVAEMEVQASALFRQHWEEVALNREVMVLDPDWISYKLVEQKGNLLVLAAYDGSEVVGYSVSYLMDRHSHYAGMSYCQNDVFFVTKPARKKSVGRRLFVATENEARRHGMQMMLWHAKKGSDFESFLDHMRRYKIQDIIYSRVL
jgi:predicted GNAT superfamily acetyltransferase